MCVLLITFFILYQNRKSLFANSEEWSIWRFGKRIFWWGSAIFVVVCVLLAFGDKASALTVDQQKQLSVLEELVSLLQQEISLLEIQQDVPTTNGSTIITSEMATTTGSSSYENFVSPTACLIRYSGETCL